MAKFPACLPRSRLEKPISREQSQPAHTYEHIANFTKDLEVRRDLGNRGPARSTELMWRGPKKDFVIPPEILRADGAFSLFSAFFTLEETSASTFLDFFFLLCLDNLRLFEFVVMSRSLRFSCNLSSLFKTFSYPFDWFIGGNLSACGRSAKLANFFFRIQRCDC